MSRTTKVWIAQVGEKPPFFIKAIDRDLPDLTLDPLQAFRFPDVEMTRQHGTPRYLTIEWELS